MRILQRLALKANFVKFSISIENGVKNFVLKYLNICFKSNTMWDHKNLFNFLECEMKLILQLVYISWKESLSAYK